MKEVTINSDDVDDLAQKIIASLDKESMMFKQLSGSITSQGRAIKEHVTWSLAFAKLACNLIALLSCLSHGSLDKSTDMSNELFNKLSSTLVSQLKESELILHYYRKEIEPDKPSDDHYDIW